MSNEIVKHVERLPAAAFAFGELERMAKSVAASGMFAVKTPEAALTLLLVAQSEGCHPVQAMMDYDIIQGKPALKSAAMLARFQKSGGKVKWTTATDAAVEGVFSHPAADGPVTVKWDEARIKTAGLSDREMHKKFPLQMKRARCITEGIRALAPQCIPAGVYTVEEAHDMIDMTPAAPVSTEAAVSAVATALTETEVDAHVDAMMECTSTGTLAEAYGAAFKHAKEAKDNKARERFKTVNEMRRAALQAKL
jgi:hypothetical protein